MVNSRLTDGGRRQSTHNAVAAERALALSYAPEPARSGTAALLALDTILGRVVRTTREPLVGQMRLTWWHDALIRLNATAAPAEPVLAGLSAYVIHAVPGAELARMVEAWELLLDPLSIDVLEPFGIARGARLFSCMARLMGGDATMTPTAGEGWALADLALHLSDPVIAEEARRRAEERLAVAFASRWPNRLRVLGALALSAKADLSPHPAPPAGPRRTARLAWHRLTGR